MIQSPSSNEFINPFTLKQWVAYYNRVIPRFCDIRFLHLPHLRKHPDVPLERLYLAPNFGKLSDADSGNRSGGGKDIIQVLSESRRCIIRGDSGAGKTTLVQYLTTIFSSLRRSLLAANFGYLIPFPFLIRDYHIHPKITFDELLEQFRNQTLWPENGGPAPDDMEQVFRSGQAFFLFDGLDEIGDETCLDAFFSALSPLFADERFHRCACMMTTRISGIADVALANHPDLTEAFGQYGLIPFTDGQVQKYIQNWYGWRESNKSERTRKTNALNRMISETDALRALAANPFLLTLMGHVHSVYGHVGSKRVDIFEKVLESYFQSIDRVRKSRHGKGPVAIDVQRRWLTCLAYGLQQQRMDPTPDASGIVIPRQRIIHEIQQELPSGWDPEKEFSYMALRSGLFSPRKSGYYQFVHLSVQDYLAAIYLYDKISSFDLTTRQQWMGIAAAYAASAVWQDTLVLLFECLSRHAGAVDAMAREIIARAENHPRTDTKFRQIAIFLTELIKTDGMGWSPETRDQAIRIVMEPELSDANTYSPLSHHLIFVDIRTWKQEVIPPLESLWVDPEAISNNSRLALLCKLTRSNPERIDSCFSDKFLTSVTNDQWEQTPRKIIQKRLESRHHRTPDLILFQDLALKFPEKANAIFSQKVLAAIPETDLYFLFPMLLRPELDELKSELIRRMPITDWFCTICSHETQGFFLGTPALALMFDNWWEQEDESSQILTWAAWVMALRDILLLKLRALDVLVSNTRPNSGGKPVEFYPCKFVEEGVARRLFFIRNQTMSKADGLRKNSYWFALNLHRRKMDRNDLDTFMQTFFELKKNTSELNLLFQVFLAAMEDKNKKIEKDIQNAVKSTDNMQQKVSLMIKIQTVMMDLVLGKANEVDLEHLFYIIDDAEKENSKSQEMFKEVLSVISLKEFFTMNQNKFDFLNIDPEIFYQNLRKHFMGI